MKRQVFNSVFLIVCFIFCILNYYVDASFENFDIAGRVVGLGNAWTSISDDATGLTFNPSGVSFIEGKSIVFSYTKPYLGLGDLNNGYIGVGFPIKEFLSCGVYLNIFGEDIYSERILGFVIGFKQLILEKQYLSIGVSVKNMSKGVSSNADVEANPFFSAKREVSGLGFDVGILYRILDVGSFGISVLNVNQPNISFVDEDKVLMKIKVGVSYYIMKELLTALDFNYFDSNYTINLGGEYKILKTGLVARIGGEIGSLDYKRVNCGIGYEFEPKGMGLILNIDYGFKFPLGFIENYGTHIVSLSLKEAVKKVVEEEVK